MGSPDETGFMAMLMYEDLGKQFSNVACKRFTRVAFGKFSSAFCAPEVCCYILKAPWAILKEIFQSRTTQYTISVMQTTYVILHFLVTTLIQ